MNRLLLTALSVLAGCPSASALQFRTFSASRHNRFTGFPAAPALNPTFMHAAVDLTGVGWDATYPLRQFTLISPLYFVGANHFRPPIGAEIRFLSASGTIRSAAVHSLYTIPNASGQPTDLLLGRLATPMLPSSGVRFLSTLLLDTEAAYIGQTLGVLGQPARGGRGIIGPISDFGGDPITGASGINTTRTFQFNYASLTGSPDDVYAESGDSGSPSFVVTGGKAAVVGTHTAVLTAAGTTTTFDTFLPAYAAQVNTIMAADGYHLTAATPKTTTLGFTRQVLPAQPRAGYPVTIQYTLSNTGAAAANNVRFSFSAPVVQALNSTGDTAWIISLNSGTCDARRGGLATAGTTQLSIAFSPGAGTIQHTAACSCDESSPGNLTGEITVIESFKSWSAGLTNTAAEGDDDQDGFSNLLEYACGGDPRRASTQVQDHAHPLGIAPVRIETVSGGTRQVVRFVRRTDATGRALAYYIESSPALSPSWSDKTSTATILSATPVTNGFELVEMALPPSNATREFLRLRVSLSE